MKTYAETPPFACLCICLLAAASACLRAQDFPLEDFYQEGTGVVVVISSSSNDYFLIQATTNADGAYTNARMVMGQRGRLEILMGSDLAVRFFRGLKYDATSPADVDADGIDDLYEMRHEPLDPLNASDASMNFDGDTLSNLQEYQAGTDISRGDSDGDGFGDDDEINDGSLPLDATSLPIDIHSQLTTATGRAISILNQARPTLSSNHVIHVAEALPASVLNFAMPLANPNMAGQAEALPASVLNAAMPLANTNLTGQAEALPHSVQNLSP